MKFSVASYHEVIKAYGKEDLEHERAREFGDLFKMSWYRILLDEAHAIKNRCTTTSKACLGLTGRYKWALTGTPIQNNLSGE